MIVKRTFITAKKVRVTKGTEVEVIPFIGVTGAKLGKVIGDNFEMITTMGVINKLITE